MKCLNPDCAYAKTKVINSRERGSGSYVLRRRSCPKCSLRYTSVEMLAYVHYQNKERKALAKKILYLREVLKTEIL